MIYLSFCDFFQNNLCVFSCFLIIGSFDNVKLTSSEDTYPNLESLLTSFSVNRNSLCTINGCDNGSGQYLLVSMDKGRFTTLNRSTLFKPESTNKKKITINKIENMIAPFNILTMCSNPFCEEFLAICGIKECNVYTLSPIGSFTGKNLSVQVGKFLFKKLCSKLYNQIYSNHVFF